MSWLRTSRPHFPE